MKNKIFIILVIFAAVMISYGNVLNAGFAWDDGSLIVKNSLVRAPLLSFEIFKQDVLNTGFVYSIYYRPIQILTYALDYRLWGMNSAAFHFTNIVLHFLNCIFVYFLTLKISRKEAPAFLASLFFAIYPAFTGAVSYISGRADLLFFLFGMVYMLLYLTFIETKRKSLLWAALASLVAALLCKEMALILPVLLVLLTFFTGKRTKEKFYYQIPGFAIAGLYLASYVLVFGERYFNLGPGGGLKDSFFTYIKIVAESIRISFFPVDLHMRRVLPAGGEYTVIAAAAIILTLLILRFKKERRVLIFSFGFFAAALMPLVFAMRYSRVFAEHWIYLASYGVILAVAVTFSDAFEDAGKSGKRFLITLLALSVAACVWMTIQQNEYWANDRSLSQRVLAFSGKDDPAMFFNVVSYMKENDAEKSREAMSAYADTMGRDPAAWYLKGRLELALGKTKTAEEDFQKVLGIDPNSPDGFMGLALLALSNDDSVSGVKNLEQTIKLNPSHYEALIVLTKAYSDSGELDKAIRTAERARDIKPFEYDALVNLGTAYTRKGMLNEAAASYMQATELYPEEPLAYYDIGQVFLSAGKRPEAMEWFHRSILASPDFKPAVDAIKELKRER